MAFDVIIGRSKKDVEKFGLKGTILMGKQYVKMGQTTSLSNPVYMDVAGAHVAFIVGKRGSGKCLHGDTLITLNDGSVAKIKDLENNDNDIFTLDSNLKIKTEQKSNFFKRPTNKLIEIGLRSGKTIKLTPEHPLLTVKGWIPAEKLGFGSRIATPRKVDAFGENSMPEHEIKLLAYLIAEGHLGNGFVLFSNMDEKILQEFEQSVTYLDSNLRVDLHSKAGCYRVSQIKKVIKEQSKRDALGRFNVGPKFAHSSIRNWIEQFGLYNKNSYTKFIPKEIFQLPKHQLSLFLNRLFSCDGTIYKKAGHWFVGYCSSSREIIDMVQHLLLRFGILSKIRNKNIKLGGKIFYSHELEVYGENVNQYLQEIGFYGKKEENAKIALLESVKIIRNPNTDTIQKEIWEIYHPENWAEIGRKMGYAHPKAMRESIHYSPSRQKMMQMALADESDLLEKFANSDIFWDEIVSMELLEGEFEVYDLTVPETHNFVANDIIVHNSYTLGAIAEGLSDLPLEIKQNLSIVLIDTMGIYWTMKYPNFQDAELAKQWGFSPKGLDVKIYTPTGFFYKFKEEGIPTDFPFSIRPIDVGPEDWCSAFELSPNSAEGVLIAKVVQGLNSLEKSYSMEELIEKVRTDEESDKVTKSIIVNQFLKAQEWGIFAVEGTPLKDMIAGGQVTVLDISPYATVASGWGIKALVVGLLCRTLFNQRMLARKTEEFKTVDSAMHYFSRDVEEKMEEPLVWIALDEAHELLPHDGKTAATDALITILREGRQPGISLILATQQPAKIHTDVMTQADIVISHRLTAQMDVQALGQLMQSYMRSGLDQELNILPHVKGAAVVFDDSNERLFPVQIRPRFTWHGGSSPTAIKERKSFFSDALKKIKDM
jgi:intein/homing endonuclease